MSDQTTTGAEEQDETPLADDELDEVSGGKILHRGNPGSSEVGDSQLDEDGGVAEE